MEILDNFQYTGLKSTVYSSYSLVNVQLLENFKSILHDFINIVYLFRVAFLCQVN